MDNRSVTRALVPRSWELAALGLLLAVSLLAVHGHAKDDSATADEPYHLFAGAENVSNGTYWVNLEHPPLAKDLAGLALAPLHLFPPAGGASRDRSPHDQFLSFLYLNRMPADAILRAARAPFPALFAMLVILVWGA